MIILMAALAAGARAESAILTERTSVYASASTGSDMLGTAGAGLTVNVVEARDGWAKISQGGKTGFVRTSVLAEIVDITAYATEDNVRVYNGCSTGSGTAATLMKGTAVRVTALWNDWCRVTKNGNNYFIRKSQLSPNKPKTDDIVAYVAKYHSPVYAARSTGSSVLGYLSYNTKVTVEEVQDNWCRVRNGSGDTAYMQKKYLSLSRVSAVSAYSTATAAKGKADAMDWWTSGIRSIFSVGTVATITDVDTGIAWKVARSGGSNHADVQPCTAEDTAAMLKVYGSWSWDRRAIIVTINGNNYAASMNGMPHGDGSITNNNFDGHHCIHFTNSRTHSTDAVCPLHQAAIEKADAAY